MTPSESFEQALARYQRNEFTDADVTACTGLSARSIRQLIKVGAVRTLSEGRGAGHIRRFDATTFKRLALASAIHGAGLSLTLAGQLAYLLPGDTRLYAHYDPIKVLCDKTLGVDSRGELPPRLETPRFDWFDADKPAAADPENDRLLEICNGRFVALAFEDRSGLLFYGDLRKAGTEFVPWRPRLCPDADVGRTWKAQRLWAGIIDPGVVKHRKERHDDDNDPLILLARTAAQRPVFKTSINISLALRLALRRYLGIEPAAMGAAA
jgi:hypothetical protein